jgi:hypothetical protein
MADLATAIETNASGPKKAAGDSGSVEQHPLPEQIEADKYLSGKTAADANHRGLRFTKLVPPGTV